ncbi:response regulator transcription factor [Paenibacillus fonticola]|uniref:response regulator transcription factor n=1 Tax=Paenibacillus fonticola TaxID=379896 RepID=UPI0003689182|nr:response regulator [Paenibacillus fonticola]
MIGKLLVVDDEAWFREGLIKMISSDQLGWEVVAEAADGEEALEAIAAHQPDLVITDIHMPVMDGLALTERLSVHGRRVMVIILTGYRDFEYAQKAVRYGAVEFLLKPCSLEETRRVLRQAYERLRLDRLEHRRYELERQVDLLRAALLGLPYDVRTAEAYGREWGGCELFLLQIHGYTPAGRAYSENDTMLLHYAADNIMSELLIKEQRGGIFTSLRTDQFIFLLMPNLDNLHFGHIVKETIYELLGLEVSWRAGGVMQSLDRLASQYSRIQTAGGENAHLNSLNHERAGSLKEELMSWLVIGDMAGMEGKIQEYLARSAHLGLQECRTEIYTLMVVFSEILLNDFKHLNAGSLENLDPGPILLAHTVPDLLSWARRKSSDFIELFERWMQEKQDNVVLKAIRYIDENYCGECTLHAAAAHVHVTPNYLSNLFKKETGVGFTNYVSRLRIEKAQLLLAGTRLRMVDIAEHTGFDNSSYFTTVFKQWTGMSPTEYRRRLEEQA